MERLIGTGSCVGTWSRSWECPEGVVPFLQERGTIPIGGRHRVEATPAPWVSTSSVVCSEPLPSNWPRRLAPSPTSWNADWDTAPSDTSPATPTPRRVSRRKLGETFVGLAERGNYEGAHQQRSILVAGAAQILGQVVEGPTDCLTPMPFTLENRAGIWRFRPDPALKLDVLLLKGLLFWKVVPELADEQSGEWRHLTALLDELLKVLRGDSNRHLVGELGEVRDQFGRLEPSRQARYLLDLVAGLTDDEFKAYHGLYCEGNSGRDLTQRARGAAIPPWPLIATSGRPA